MRIDETSHLVMIRSNEVARSDLQRSSPLFFEESNLHLDFHPPSYQINGLDTALSEGEHIG